MPERSESSYVTHDIVPIFAKLGYPGAGEHERAKINDVPLYRPSGGRSGSTMDIVYYHNGEPLLLVEAKRKHKSHEQALDEAENYIRNFPKKKEFAPSGRPPRYIATTVGREIRFYLHRFEPSEDGFLNQVSEPVKILTFDELLEKYGLLKGYKPKILDAERFRKEFLNELTAVYKFSDDGRITPDVIKNMAWHILNYLEDQKKYANRYPYTELDEDIFRHETVKDLHKRFDLIGSLGPEIAREFRSFILRAFQGTNLNQYLTEQCVIAFMFNLIGEIKPDWKVLDFQCGSGGFFAGAVERGVPLENIRGVDIDELPYIIARTYLALYFKKSGAAMKDIPVRQGNGLLYYGNDFDLIVGNPAGGSKYDEKGLDDILKNLERDLDVNGRDDKFSEYNFSIQQAVRSCSVGGKICLVLPEGLFSNSQDEMLRKYIAKHCKVHAIVSLPRGVFKKGTTTRSTSTGSQTSSQKMSILFAEKVKEVIDGEGVEIEDVDLNYPVFLANIAEPESTSGKISDWLEPRLNMVFEEWKEWQATRQLIELDESLIKAAQVAPSEAKKKGAKKDNKQGRLFEEPIKQPSLKEAKSAVLIEDALKGLFKNK